jgi:hypothetical protein
MPHHTLGALVALIFCYLSHLTLRAQGTDASPLDTALSTDLDTELQLDTDESTAEYESLIEECADLLAAPIDLNTATAADLQLLPFLTDADIRAILRFRYQYDGFRSRYELLLVPGLARQYARLALPYVTVAADETPAPRRERSAHQVLATANRCLETRAGYRDQTPEAIAADSAYRGNPWHHKLRYQYNYGRTLRAGLTVEKDPGEAYRSGAPWIGDSFNYYVAYRREHGSLRQLIVGDYRAAMGCGLLINQQFSVGKSMLSTQLLGRNASIAPLTSAEEYKFQHGVAAQLHLSPHWDLTAFVSSRLIDGRATADTLSSITTDGYHRTQSEEQKRHSARMSLGGVHAEWSNHWLRLGANALYTHFDRTYCRATTYYNSRAFRGCDLTQASLEYSLQYRHLSAKGEVARSDNGGWGTVHLIRYAPADRWQLLTIGRALGRRYQQLHASTYSESSDVQAERGLYLQALYNAAAHCDLTAAWDYFQLTAPKYGIKAASHGYEGQLRSDVKYDRWSASLRYRLKHKYATNSVSSRSEVLQGYFRHTADLILTWQACTWLQLKQQWEYRIYARQFVGASEGLGFSQRVSFKQAGRPVAVHALGEWFQTDDYNSRIYLSDLNLRYSFGSTMLYGRGVRYGLACSWRLSKRCLLEGKYTLVNYAGRNTLSSDLQEIRGNVQQDVRLQCLWTL